MDRSMIEARSGADAEAIAAREAALSKPQRIAPISYRDLTADALGTINGIRASVGAEPTTGEDVPGYFLTMVKSPAMFRHQLEMGAAIFTGSVPARERELAILRVGWLMRAPYEWGEHVDIGKRAGLTADEVERITTGSSAPGWNDEDRAVLCAVEELLAEQALSDEVWSQLASHYSEPQLIEFLTIVGQYVATGMLQNALRIRLAADNRGLTQR